MISEHNSMSSFNEQSFSCSFSTLKRSYFRELILICDTNRNQNVGGNEDDDMSNVSCDDDSSLILPLPSQPHSLPPPPLPLSLRDSRWEASPSSSNNNTDSSNGGRRRSKFIMDSPPLCRVGRKRLRPAEQYGEATKDVPFTAPKRSVEVVEDYFEPAAAKSLQLTVDLLDSAIEILGGGDDY